MTSRTEELPANAEAQQLQIVKSVLDLVTSSHPAGGGGGGGDGGEAGAAPGTAGPGPAGPGSGDCDW